MNENIRLHWGNHQSVILSMFQSLLSTETLLDVTLACDGHHFRAHRIVLSACSPYFKELLDLDTSKHPIVYLRDVASNELQALVEFMYRGEVNIPQKGLVSFLELAKALQIRGLGEISKKSSCISSNTVSHVDIQSKGPVSIPSAPTLTPLNITASLPVLHSDPGISHTSSSGNFDVPLITGVSSIVSSKRMFQQEMRAVELESPKPIKEAVLSDNTILENSLSVVLRNGVYDTSLGFDDDVEQPESMSHSHTEEVKLEADEELENCQNIFVVNENVSNNQSAAWDYVDHDKRFGNHATTNNEDEFTIDANTVAEIEYDPGTDPRDDSGKAVLDQEFICSLCNKAIYKLVNYNYHRRYGCSSVPAKYPCRFCDYKAKRQCTLRIHIRNRHSRR